MIVKILLLAIASYLDPQMVSLVAPGPGTPNGGGGGGGCTPASGYAHCAVIQIDHTQIGGSTLTNYPLWIPLTLTGGCLNVSCFDTIVTSDNLGVTKIPWEVESFNSTTKVVNIHALVASVSNAADSFVYVSYGNVAIVSAQNTGANGPTHVWGTGSTYQAVYHVPELTGTSGYVDSTANANNGTHTANDPTANSSGRLNGAQTWNGTSNNIASTSLINLSTTFTVTAWINFNAVTGYQYIIDNGAGGSGITIAEYNNSHFRTYISATGGTNNCTGTDSDTTLVNSTWYHIALYWNTSTSACTFYINGATGPGVWNPTFPNSGNPTFNEGAFNMNLGGGLSGNYFSGVMDEIRFYTGDRTSQILADYNSQKPSSTFLTITYI